MIVSAAPLTSRRFLTKTYLITVPDEFLYDPVSKTYGDPTRRPEVKSSTIEFIAPSEYTVRVHPLPYIFPV